jgi:hypothetical protein
MLRDPTQLPQCLARRVAIRRGGLKRETGTRCSNTQLEEGNESPSGPRLVQTSPAYKRSCILKKPSWLGLAPQGGNPCPVPRTQHRRLQCGRMGSVQKGERQCLTQIERLKIQKSFGGDAHCPKGTFYSILSIRWLITLGATTP